MNLEKKFLGIFLTQKFSRYFMKYSNEIMGKGLYNPLAKHTIQYVNSTHIRAFPNGMENNTLQTV